jgi:hypothetical protein
VATFNKFQSFVEAVAEKKQDDVYQMPNPPQWAASAAFNH